MQDTGRARQKELKYEASIDAYKKISTFRFVTKWNHIRDVRQKKREMYRVNRSIRAHYYVRLSTSEIRTSW